MKTIAFRSHRVTFAFSLLFTLVSVVRAQEKVSFPSTDGDLKRGVPTTITGYLYKPTGSGPFPAVIGLHGCDGAVNEEGKIRPPYGTWGEILSQKGYFFLLIDSFQPRGQGSLCAIQPISARPILPNRETPRDAFGGMNYMRSRADVRPNNIAILGESYGATAMLFTIADGALPKDVPPEKDFQAAIALYPNCTLVSDQNPHWRPRQRMLLLMGESDNYTPAAPCKELVTRAQDEGGPPIEVHFYPDTYHGFDHPDLPITVVTSVKLPPDGHSPTVGSNPEARADAINRVTQFLASELK